MPLERKEGWPEYFVKAFVEKQDKKFRYGDHDCCLSVCDCVLAMTGVDLAKGFRGYKTKKGAYSKIKPYGSLGGLIQSVMDQHGIVSVAMKHAGRGDVALVDDARSGEAFGIVNTAGTDIAIASATGWIYVPMNRAKKFWRI